MNRRRLLATALTAALVSAPAALAGTAAVAPAYAADPGISWGVQPSTPSGPDGRADLSYQVGPGTIISDWIAVTNHSTGPATFRVYAADATTDYDTASFTLVGADEASKDLGAWTSIDGKNAACAPADAACIAAVGTTVTLDPGARADIPFAITVPADATPGDHSAGIVASFVSQAATGGGTGVSLEQRVGTRVYLRVDGPLTPQLTVSGAVAGYSGGLNPFSGTATVGFDVTNTGNTRVSAVPTVRLNGPFGIALATVPLDRIQNVVPGRTGHVTAELAGIPPLVLLFADVTVDPAPAGGVAAGDPLPAVSTVSVMAWALPWMLLAAALVIAALIAVAVWWRRRSRALLAEEIAAYADEVREEALRAAAREEVVR